MPAALEHPLSLEKMKSVFSAWPIRLSAFWISPTTLSVSITKSPYLPRPLFPCHFEVGKMGVWGEPSGT